MVTTLIWWSRPTKARRLFQTSPMVYLRITGSGWMMLLHPVVLPVTTTRKWALPHAGAWEAVKRHFREQDVDVQSDPFTVMAIGDMSGDVFGNGMLLSRKIKLVAAFNHMHIFLDPDPDMAASFRERQRLFRMGRSSWEDYKETLISKGGGVYSRQAKKIKLTKEVREMLGTTETAMQPLELIRAILRMQVDLFWNGGIGTYVKASTESHADVGDRSNDNVRVDADELQCKVVG